MSTGKPKDGDFQMVAVPGSSKPPLPPAAASNALVEYTNPVAFKEEEEDLEVKLRRIIDNVPVRVSNTSGSSAGSGSGDFHQEPMACQQQTRNSAQNNQNNEIAKALRDVARTMRMMMERMDQDRRDAADHGPEVPEHARFGEFRKANPPTFKGTTNPNVADEWIKNMEKIFTVVPCMEQQKVTFATYMLEGDAGFWWTGAQRLLEATGTAIDWELFKAHFYEKYFPESVRNAKDIEFMQLIQGGMNVAQYTAKFEELIKFSRMYQGNPNEYWKCIKYESGLKAELNFAVAHLEIRDFCTLVNKCRIIEEGQRKLSIARSNSITKRLAPQGQQFKKQNRLPFPSHQKTQGPRRNFYQGRPNNNNKGKAPQRAPAAPPRSLPSTDCPKCGKNHGSLPCRAGMNVCYRFGKPGHISRDCTERNPPTPNPKPQFQGRVFTVNAEETTKSRNLIEVSANEAEGARSTC